MTGSASFSILFLLALMTTYNCIAQADPSECQDAINSYNTATSELSDTLQTYSSCIADSKGHDDCSSEFSSLRSAQDDFELSVSSYGSDCN